MTPASLTDMKKSIVRALQDFVDIEVSTHTQTHTHMGSNHSAPLSMGTDCSLIVTGSHAYAHSLAPLCTHAAPVAAASPASQ